MDSDRKNNVSKLHGLSMTLWNKLIMIPVLAIFSACSSPPPPTGLSGGHLRPCPQSPNCVISEPAAAKNIEPLPLQDNPEQSWRRARQAIEAMGGTIVEDRKSYLWATFTSSMFRFVDDVELRLDLKNNCIQLRSASRLGYSDFGVNHRRMEKLRAHYLLPENH